MNSTWNLGLRDKKFYCDVEISAQWNGNLTCPAAVCFLETCITSSAK